MSISRSQHTCKMYKKSGEQKGTANGCLTQCQGFHAGVQHTVLNFCKYIAQALKMFCCFCILWLTGDNFCCLVTLPWQIVFTCWMRRSNNRSGLSRSENITHSLLHILKAEGDPGKQGLWRSAGPFEVLVRPVGPAQQGIRAVLGSGTAPAQGNTLKACGWIHCVHVARGWWELGGAGPLLKMT